ncbi:DUF805 domain-containing protein [Curtobacterium sp. NPDC090217]|uniref:DUF805 domain-containing protein n=1 Tax=Curtobacterium sp. NPDC090217 TaxID=3363970 RepID=UPI0037FD1A8E
MGDRGTFRQQALARGPQRDVGPLVAWARFWTQGWRFSGRASRSEFAWPMVFELIVVVLAVGIPVWSGTPWRWTWYADPFGIMPSPAVYFHLWGSGNWWWGYGDGADVPPRAWDLPVIAWVAVTAIPRWTLLVRRLHDRDHTGLWVLLLAFTGPIGWLVVSAMVVRRPRAAGVRFDRTLWDAYKPSATLPPESQDTATATPAAPSSTT